MGAQYIFVFLGGGLGAVCRYLATSFFAVRFGSSFPYGTLFVNVSGSFLMGLLIGVLPLLPRGALLPENLRFVLMGLLPLFPFGDKYLPENLRLLLAVGFLGGFTTFSSFSMETLTLLQGANALSALWNVLANVAFGVAAAWAGLLLVRAAL